MKSRGKIFRLWLGCVAGIAVVMVLPAHAATLSPDEYRQQLHDFSSRVDQLKDHPEQAAKLERDVPGQVSVGDGGREYSVSYAWLKQELKQFEHSEAKSRSAFLQPIHDHLTSLEKETEDYERAQAAPGPDRPKLQQILDRRDFHKAHGPTWWDIMVERIKRWISGFFERHPIYGRGTDIFQILVYAAIAVAFSMFAIWLKRRLDHPRGDLSREIIPFAPSARGWSSWLAEARAAAKESDWRNAVHLAYWAGISFLEEHGAWKPDRARTPREYLRMLGTRKPQYPTLSALTRNFEVIWYGRGDANAADFNEALQQLEKLGCK
jgi:hypothetical protein